MDTQVQKVLLLIKERSKKYKPFHLTFYRNRSFTPLLLLLVCTVFLSGCMSQHQQKRKLDLSSKVGLGFTQSLSSLKGLHFQYGINNRFIFESVMGGNLVQNQVGNSDFKWGLAVGSMWQLLKIEDEAFVGLGLRYLYSNQRHCLKEGSECSNTTPISLQTTTKAFELPIRIAWYPHRVVSFHLDFGLSFSWENLDTLLPTEVPHRWEIFESTNQWGNFGLTVWF